jgi:hypothetical protein
MKFAVVALLVATASAVQCGLCFDSSGGKITCSGGCGSSYLPAVACGLCNGGNMTACQAGTWHSGGGSTYCSCTCSGPPTPPTPPPPTPPPPPPTPCLPGPRPNCVNCTEPTHICDGNRCFTRCHYGGVPCCPWEHADDDYGGECDADYGMVCA